MKIKKYTVTGVAALTIPVDHKQNPFALTVHIKEVSTTAATYTLYYTLSDILRGHTPNWTAYSAGLTNATTEQVVNFNNGPVTAIKLDVTASDGSVTIEVINPTAA